MKDTDNYFIVKGKWKLVYKEYKTAKHLGKQIINVPDHLKEILQQLFEPNISSKISSVFKEVHGLEISNRFLRYSKATDTARKHK